MEILVCIKQVPGTNRVEVDPVTGVLKRDGVESKMNPYDLYALETALRLRERHGGSVSVMTMGPPQAEAVIAEAYSMGADRGFLLSDRGFAGADVLATSYTLAQGIRRAGEFDLIVCGKQTTDGDTAQVGAEIGEYLQLPSLANVTAIDGVSGDEICVTCDMQSETYRYRVSLPCVLSVDKDICQPRLPSYLKKKATADRGITVLSLGDLEDTNALHYGLNGSPTQVRRIFPPTGKAGQCLWEGDGLAEKMADKLRELKFI